MSKFWLQSVSFQDHLIVHSIGFIITIGISYIIMKNRIKSEGHNKYGIKFLLTQGLLFIISFIMPYILGIFKGEPKYLSDFWTEVSFLLVLVVVHSIGNYSRFKRDIKK